MRWVETVVLTLLVAGIGYALRPSDPFYLQAEFPWLLFAPVLIALRYGAVAGLVSTGVLALLWAGESVVGVAPKELPAQFFAGALILTLLCGEFAGLWEARLSRAEGSLRYVRERLDRLTRQHFLLLTSHQRLEQEQLVRPVTLRAALGRIRRLALEEDGEGALPGAQALAALLAQFCQLETASLHLVRAGRPLPQPVATVGAATALDPADPLVRHCLEQRAIAHVQAGELAGMAGERYLLVAPVVAADGELIALLAVQQMPFLALHEEALSALAVLLGYYADALRAPRAARVLSRALPSCPPAFAEELVRLHRLHAEQGVASSLLLLRFGAHPDRAAFAAHLRREVRDLDQVWQLDGAADAESLDMLLLLPLAGEAAASEAVDRLERALEARYRLGFHEARIRPYAAALAGRDAFVCLRLFLDQHGVGA